MHDLGEPVEVFCNSALPLYIRGTIREVIASHPSGYGVYLIEGTHYNQGDRWMEHQGVLADRMFLAKQWDRKFTWIDSWPPINPGVR